GEATVLTGPAESAVLTGPAEPTVPTQPAEPTEPTVPIQPTEPTEPTQAAESLAPALLPEPAQPVFPRYWLHGKGPAPAGNMPVAVHFSPARVALSQAAGAQDAAVVRLTVACGPEPASGVVDLDVPAGLAATPDGPLRYDLPALRHARWDLAVRGAAGAPPGQYLLAARIRHPLGQGLG